MAAKRSETPVRFGPAVSRQASGPTAFSPSAGSILSLYNVITGFTAHSDRKETYMSSNSASARTRSSSDSSKARVSPVVPKEGGRKVDVLFTS